MIVRGLKNIGLFTIGLFFLIPFYSQNIFEVEEEGYEKVYKRTDAYKDFLKYKQEITEFDREKWEGIRQNIIERFSDEYYEGTTTIEDSDNPYRKSRGDFRRYWREKNQKRIKRLPKKKEKIRQRDRVDIPNVRMSPFWSNFIMIIALLGLAALIFFLFFKASQDQSKKKIHGDIEGIIPTAIPKTELELRLDEALAKEDYREAIRIYFIFIIRGLIKKDWIEWEKEKTNFSYLTEMRGNPYESRFEACVSVYEIVWYGEREITRKEYDLLEPRFKNLVKELNK